MDILKNDKLSKGMVMVAAVAIFTILSCCRPVIYVADPSQITFTDTSVVIVGPAVIKPPKN